MLLFLFFYHQSMKTKTIKILPMPRGFKRPEAARAIARSPLAR